MIKAAVIGIIAVFLAVSFASIAFSAISEPCNPFEYVWLLHAAVHAPLFAHKAVLIISFFVIVSTNAASLTAQVTKSLSFNRFAKNSGSEELIILIKLFITEIYDRYSCTATFTEVTSSINGLMESFRPSVSFAVLTAIGI